MRTSFVLNVEDNPAQGYVMRRLLAHEGFRTETVTSATEALQRVTEGELIPDLMLVDLHLPDLGGIELCRCIRADKRTSAVPFVLYTSQHPAGWAACAAYQVGASFLFLPVTAEELAIVVRGNLARAM